MDMLPHFWKEEASKVKFTGAQTLTGRCALVNFNFDAPPQVAQHISTKLVHGQNHVSIPKLPPYDIHLLKSSDNTEICAEEKVSASKGLFLEGGFAHLLHRYTSV